MAQVGIVSGRARYLELGVALAVILLAMRSSVFALDSTLDASQHAHAAAHASDPNGKIPPGSYQLTCVVLDALGDDLKAICQTIWGAMALGVPFQD